MFILYAVANRCLMITIVARDCVFTGVGGFVVNDEGEVLMIKERYTGVKPLWKLPGGGADTSRSSKYSCLTTLFALQLQLIIVQCYDAHA